jgi:broad specificity phosphatase PhoE
MTYKPSSSTCIAFLLRHGATANNMAVPPRIQGSGENPGLSNEGRLQAGASAEFLADQPIVAAYSSPLARALQTAEIVSRPHELAVQTVDDLREVDVGRWEGKSWEQISQLEPEAHRLFVNDPGTHGYAGGENLSQVQERVFPSVERLMAAHLGQCILIVGHNVVNRTLLAALLQLPVARARGIAQDNCGINVIRFRDRQFKLLSSNVAFHLQSLAQAVD